MASLKCLSFRKVLLLSLMFFLFTSSFLFASSDTDHELQAHVQHFVGRTRRLLENGLELDQEDEPKKRDKPLSSSTETQIKLVKNTNLSSKNQTKLSGSSPKTKPSNSTKTSELKKLTSTSKPTNSTKPSSASNKKSTDLLKLSSPKNKTTKPASIKSQSSQISSFSDKKKGNDLPAEKPSSYSSKPNKNIEKTKEIKKTQTKEIKPFWLEQEEDDDLVSEFRDLPTKFQRNLIPDLERISTKSRIYITRANKEITKGVKPYFGNKHAPTIASAVSCIFLLVPLLLVSLIFNRFKAYFSLQKILICIQVYLSIYFSILCISSLVTGLEPLRFLYATSRSTYIWLQVLQTLGYVLYLLLLLMYLVLVFSTDCGPGLKLLSLVQTFMSFSVGLHYYVAVFHRVVFYQPPKTSWKVHGIYATCFLLICLLSTAERRKKAYLAAGGEEGKKN